MTQTPANAPATPPAVAFARDVERWAMDFLRQHHPAAATKAAGRITLAVRQAAAIDSKIYECDLPSIARAVAMCVVTDLAPGGALPLVYLIPRKSKDRATGRYTYQLNWQISVRGLEVLAHRAGYRVRSVPVFATDHFRVSLGLRPDIEHEPDEDAEQDWETLRGVYVVAYQHGSTEPFGFEWVPRSVLARLRAESDAAESDFGPWKRWPVEMARARAIGYALRRGVVPLTESALSEAAAHDASPEPVAETPPMLHATATTEEQPRGLRAVLGVAEHVVEVAQTVGAAEAVQQQPAQAPVQQQSPADPWEQAKAWLDEQGLSRSQQASIIGRAQKAQGVDPMTAVQAIVAEMPPPEDMP